MNETLSKRQPVNYKKCGHTANVLRTEVMAALQARTGMTCPKCRKPSAIWQASQPGTQPRAC